MGIDCRWLKLVALACGLFLSTTAHASLILDEVDLEFVSPLFPEQNQRFENVLVERGGTTVEFDFNLGVGPLFAVSVNDALLSIDFIGILPGAGGVGDVFRFLDLDWVDRQGRIVDLGLSQVGASGTTASFTDDSVTVDISSVFFASGSSIDVALETAHEAPEPSSLTLLVFAGVVMARRLA